MKKHLILPLSAVFVVSCAPNSSHKNVEIGAFSSINALVDTDSKIEIPSSPNSKVAGFEDMLLNGLLDKDTRKIIGAAARLKALQEGSFEKVNYVDISLDGKLNRITQVYQEKTDALNQLHEGLQVKNQEMHDELRGATILAETVPILGSVVEDMRSRSMEATKENLQKLKDESIDQATQVLTSEYNNMTPIDQSAFDKLSDLPPQQAAIEAERLVQGLAKKMLPTDIPAEKRGEVESAITRSFAVSALKMQAEGFARQKRKDGEQDQQIESHEEKIKKILANEEAQVKFNSLIQKRVDSIADSQKHMAAFIDRHQKDIDAHGHRIGEVEGKVKFMQDYMYGKMSASEQLAMLESGHYGDPKLDDIKSLIADKKGIVAREEFQQGVADFGRMAGDFATIASSVGVNPKIVKAATQASRVAKAGSDAFGKFVKMDYLGAVASLVGLFGGGGPSVEEQRHKEVMGAFTKLNEKLDVMSKELNGKLVKLSEQLEKATYQILDMQMQTHKLILSQNEVMKEISDKYVNSCEVVRLKVRQSSWAQIAPVMPIDIRMHLKSCIFGLDLRLYANAERTAFLSSTYLTRENSSEAQDDDYMEKLYRYMSSRGKLLEAVKFSLKPTLNLHEMREKMSILKDGVGSQESLMAELFIARRVYPQAILKHADWFFSLLPGMMIYKYTDKNMNLKIGIEGQNVGKDEVIMLSNLLGWVNRSIAQESLINSEGTVALMSEHASEILDTNKCNSNTDENEKNRCKKSVEYAHDLLRINKTLLENFVQFSIMNEWFATGNRDTALAVYIKGKNISQISSMLKTPWKFSVKNERVIVSFLDHEIVLNGDENFSKQKLQQSFAIESLVKLRDKVISKIADMQTNASLPADLRKFITYEAALGVKIPAAQ